MKKTTSYLITNNITAKNNFYISHKKKTRKETTHWHDFYEIHLITSGLISEKINNNDYLMEEGWLYFLRPFDIHSYNSEDDVSLFKIQFNIDLLNEKLQKIILSCNNEIIIKLNLSEYNELVSKMNSMLKEYENSDNYSNLKINLLLNEVIIDILRKKNIVLNHNNNDKDIIQIALKYIQQNYTKNITLREISKHISISPNYFCSIFHKEIGQSFKQYINELRLDHAATLLRTTNESIEDISARSGFSNLTTFFRSFKKQYETSPAKYRSEKTIN